jgi:hypothetical protein
VPNVPQIDQVSASAEKDEDSKFPQQMIVIACATLVGKGNQG